MSWNKSEAVSYARIHAQPQTTHYCARAVAAAIRAGGVKIEGPMQRILGVLWKRQDSLRYMALR